MLITRQNMDIADSGRRTAEATRLDSQSMKTIAILTMVFLPGTFVAVSNVYHLCFTDYSLSFQVTDAIVIVLNAVFLQQRPHQLVSESGATDGQCARLDLFRHYDSDDGRSTCDMVVLDAVATEAGGQGGCYYFETGKGAVGYCDRWVLLPIIGRQQLNLSLLSIPSKTRKQDTTASQWTSICQGHPLRAFEGKGQTREMFSISIND